MCGRREVSPSKYIHAHASLSYSPSWVFSTQLLSLLETARAFFSVQHHLHHLLPTTVFSTGFISWTFPSHCLGSHFHTQYMFRSTCYCKIKDFYFLIMINLLLRARRVVVGPVGGRNNLIVLQNASLLLTSCMSHPCNNRLSSKESKILEVNYFSLMRAS